MTPTQQQLLLDMLADEAARELALVPVSLRPDLIGRFIRRLRSELCAAIAHHERALGQAA